MLLGKANSFGIDPLLKMQMFVLLIASTLPIFLCRGVSSSPQWSTTADRAFDPLDTRTPKVPSTLDLFKNSELLENSELGRYKMNNESAELLSVLEKAYEGYNKEFPPSTYGSPVDITVDVQIRRILGMSEVSMEILLDLDLGFYWCDERLKFRAPQNYTNGSWGPPIHKNLKDRIWTPPLSLLNEKESVDHTQAFNRDFFRWFPSGCMYYRTGIISKFSCKMSLQNFPLDTQMCSVNIGAHGHHDKQLKIQWLGGKSLDPEFTNFVGDMSLMGHRERQRVRYHEGLSFTVLVYDLMLQRSIGYFVIGAYFPAALVVIISWLAFWMVHTGERMALGVTCVLTITTLLLSAQASSPRVSYIKAIDIYMGACFATVFVTLVYSTAVGSLLNKLRSKGLLIKAYDEEQHQLGRNQEERTAVSTPAVVILRYDTWARRFFPLIFLGFNILYWAYYIDKTKVDLSKNKWIVVEAEARLIDEF